MNVILGIIFLLFVKPIRRTLIKCVRKMRVFNISVGSIYDSDPASDSINVFNRADKQYYVI
jgi:hypothetical protein